MATTAYSFPPHSFFMSFATALHVGLATDGSEIDQDMLVGHWFLVIERQEKTIAKAHVVHADFDSIRRFCHYSSTPSDAANPSAPPMAPTS